VRTAKVCTSVTSTGPCNRPLVLHPFTNKERRFDAVTVCRVCDSHPVWVDHKPVKA
jgi:hypothetical protein